MLLGLNNADARFGGSSMAMDLIVEFIYFCGGYMPFFPCIYIFGILCVTAAAAAAAQVEKLNQKL